MVTLDLAPDTHTEDFLSISVIRKGKRGGGRKEGEEEKGDGVYAFTLSISNSVHGTCNLTM